MLRSTLAVLLFAAVAAPLSAQTVKDPLVIVLIGAPGAGKTTHARNISRKYNIPSYSMPQILDKEAGWMKSLKKNEQAGIQGGDLVNDEIANDLVRKYVGKQKTLNGFVMDGYPSSMKQAEGLKALLEEYGLPEPIVIQLDVSDDVVRKRLVGRGNKADTPENVERRLADYRKEEKLMIERYGSARILKIDSSRSVGEVWTDVQAAIEHRRQ